MANRQTGRNPYSKNMETSPYIQRKLKEKADQNKFYRILTLMTIAFIAVLLSLFIFADNENFLETHFGKNSIITKIFQKLSRGNSNKENAEFNLPFGPRRQNILFLGVDDSKNSRDPWTGTRTDTILLMNIDPRAKSVNAISIPRDSKVYLPHNNGVNKINAAHAIGGIDMTIETIEDTFGVKIDRYIMVHDLAVEKIVDAMGGINIYVEKPMHYNDYSGNLHINFDRGNQHLSGIQAVEYLRFRHDALGDIGRTQRQQWFMRGLLTSLKSPSTITKIPEIISISKQYIKTDMSLYELSQYAALSRHIDMDKIEIATLPGEPNGRGHISYWILDPVQTQQTINRLIYRQKPQVDPNATQYVGSVMYSQSRSSDAQLLISQLKASGIKVKCIGHVNRIHSQFMAHTDKVTNDYYNDLRKKIPSASGLQFVYDPMNYYCADSDFTIILTGTK